MNNKEWFKQAKFGMFIHWGLYSIPAGEWKGERTEFPAEWLMTYHRIPIKEYEKLASIFNPIYFDAEEWVKLAKEAGMKVIFELPDQVEKAGYSTATKALLDSTKIEQLGWKAKTGIADGLAKTVQILRTQTD